MSRAEMEPDGGGGGEVAAEEPLGTKPDDIMFALLELRPVKG